MDFATIRAQLASTKGRHYWRCLEELAQTEDFRAAIEQVLPQHAAHLQPSAWPEGINRRKFLAMLGASLALAGVSGCSVQPPSERIVPYVRAPQQRIPGRPLFYATTMTMGGLGIGLLAESHEGRPTKIEGNPSHPASLGATDLFAQASILDLYDPDRSQNLIHSGQIANWDDAVAAMRQAMDRQREKKGRGLRILTETVTSPTLVAQFDDLRNVYPEAKWVQYEPITNDNLRTGSQLAFGEYVNTIYHFDRADVVVALDSDFVSCGPAQLRYAHDFAQRRRAGIVASEGKSMSRVYAVEPIPSSLGAQADHRWPLRADQVETLAAVLAARLDSRLQSPRGANQLPIPEKAIRAMVDDLQKHRGSSIVIAGQQQSAAVHALAHAMNHALDNAEKTVTYTEAIEARPTDSVRALRELAEEMDAGQVEMLVILGGNPAYNAPADLQFAQRMVAKRASSAHGEDKVPLRIHLGNYVNETAVLCHWHIPESHYLEQWSDARAYDGTASIVQPLIAPLYGGRSAHELLVALAQRPEHSGYELVRDHWQRFWKKQDGAQRFDDFWQTILNDGVIPGTAATSHSVKLRDDWFTRITNALPATTKSLDGQMEVVFRPDPTVYDGRFANNGWLQETPKPLSKLTWDNAVMLSPATAQKYKVGDHPAGHGGEHGEALSNVITIEYRGRTLSAPVWVVPGHADECVTLLLGYGRTRAGNVGSDVGYNAYQLRTSEAMGSDGGLKLETTNKTYQLASTQQHFRMEGREPVRVAAIGEYRKGPSNKNTETPSHHEAEEHATLYPPYPYTGYKWGMVIDLAACVGCNACVVACQAENNIPVVGKPQVLAGREMHWIRVDRYYATPPGDRQDGLANPEIYYQPLPCMHCETAPCELVCPVGATVHSDEGLNDMVYNRCVGTRYCSNNCPYKVRRFNFLAFASFNTPTLKLLNNPEVTVRSRGVMEKCTYCVQRIRQAEIQAEREDRKIRDGEVLTACQAACPSGAITFGDLNDPKSEVAQRAAEARNYALLGELNTQPRTTYLAVVRNPHPDLGNET